jgi:hypothetical protein
VHAYELVICVLWRLLQVGCGILVVSFVPSYHISQDVGLAAVLNNAMTSFDRANLVLREIESFLETELADTPQLSGTHILVLLYSKRKARKKTPKENSFLILFPFLPLSSSPLPPLHLFSPSNS